MSTTVSILEFERDIILAEALREAARTPRYAKVEPAELSDRLETLFDTLLDAAERRQLTEIVTYAELLATRRSSAGYDIGDVQVAINALEEAIWRRLLAMCPPDDLSEALRLISTILGAAKDALARTWVERTRRGPVLDVASLFGGTDGA